jgi:hypothetical protein
MAGTVKLPFIGEVKTGWVIAGVGAVVLIVGVAWYRNRASSAAATSSGITSADQAAANTQTIDPETGFPEGSAEDEQALAELAEGGSYEGGYYGDGYGYDYGTEPVTAAAAANTGPGTFTSNSAWLNWILANNSTGYSSSQIISAVSLWENETGASQLTTTDVSVIQACIAVAGQPPTYPGPPSAAPQGSTGGGSSTSTGTTTGSAPEVTVPKVVGDKGDTAGDALRAAGFKVTQTPSSTPKGKSTKVISQNPAGGSKAAKGSTVVVALEVVS